ncbi:unnamed protein product [Prunus armeniaca]|uniref:Uncharacterized protein n=1 Tax=Prunus armeniaca TaxID=36596 RepID=A0A6J5WEG3_PRUAR|nr:unnamed protein product [Prunus armeniaca]
MRLLPLDPNADTVRITQQIALLFTLIISSFCLLPYPHPPVTTFIGRELSDSATWTVELETGSSGSNEQFWWGMIRRPC